MKIYLYLNSKIVNFSLPEEIDGSFSFDYKEDEEYKLINIEARDGKWVLYSTKNVKLISNNNNIEQVVIDGDNFYVVRRGDVDYLLYIKDLKRNSVKMYKYDEKLNLLIGKNDNANIKYICPYLDESLVKVYYKDNRLILEKNDKILGVYLNNKSLLTSSTFIKIGDQINIFGLKFLLLKDHVLIVGSDKRTVITENLANISKCVIDTNLQLQNFEIEEQSLYKKGDYYSKSPRIRRFIETKVVKLSPPPKNDVNHELPIILTVGPMMTMGIMSAVSLISTGSKLFSGQATIADEWPGLITSGLMIISIIMWPILTRNYNEKMRNKQNKKVISKYREYLNEKMVELEKEKKYQKDIILENLISLEECLRIIDNRNMNFWDKRIEQNDFLVARVGVGNQPFDVKIEFPEEGFTIEEDELRKQAEDMINEFKYIENVPVGYSFYENKLTAVMGDKKKSFSFVSNILLQLITFYSYDDLKLVVFTTKDNKSEWEYIKYLNHSFNNERTFRFFASDNDSAKEVSEYLNIELNERISRKNNNILFKPHYLIVVDDYEKVKRYDFIKTLTEVDGEYGFSIIIIENRLSKLPSKCNNFISLSVNGSAILKNSYEKQEQIVFAEDINYNIDMMAVAKILANIPVEFEEGVKTLPDMLSFMEMERVGKIEQLNILNRWKENDSTISLKTEIGVDEQGDLLYLDLHEKHHGPHGLIAGTTGSGKSEFIITYILSMAINYSPDDVSFILIDYKGGGLALAFENKNTGIYLPHLAGIITNLDKSEMDRTLVSINSELHRRQEMFNYVRDMLGESTIDIYKYQRLYHEGKINKPIPHLFIICDEFAELKAQQPEFMENLISVARIGRSLGVHLILATQKPSGVVNEQIWSNTRFRVCFKVQDESDSKEMLKRTEAASLKQAGRFYLQVGYDELFTLGQSAWCGTKYYPSDVIVKQVDKSINFINDYGVFIKSIQSSSGVKLEQKGEQLSEILKYIMEVSNKLQKRSRRLWLDSIPETILVDDLEKKYNIKFSSDDIKAIVGEYDAPEKQYQGPIIFDYLRDGNTIIYGNDGSENECFLNTLIYSTVKNYDVSKINYYIVDYGSESLRKYKKLAHVGGIVFAQEEEKYNNLFKMIKEEIYLRKNLFADYGGEFINYINNHNDVVDVPLKVVIINNYDSVYEANPNIYDELPELVRDSERYGIIFIITANAANSVHSRISSNFSNVYTFKLKDLSDYSNVLGIRVRTYPRDIFGRGLCKTNDIHEFQVASVLNDDGNINNFILDFINKHNSISSNKVKRIPILPNVVGITDVKDNIKTIYEIPIGISKKDLEIVSVDYLSNLGNIVTSTKLENTKDFVKSLLQIFKLIPNNNLIVIDPMKRLLLQNNEYSNYYVDNLSEVLTKINEYVVRLINSKSNNSGVIIIYGLSKFINKINNATKISEFINNLKKYEKISLIIVDDYNKIKNYCFETWFAGIFNLNNGIWIGRGITDQNLLRLTSVSKEMTKDYKNDMGYLIDDGMAVLCKLIDFISNDVEE